MFMRLFIAIEIPEEIKKQMAEAQRRLQGIGVDASWTRSEGIHLTLKFLGEIPESKVPEIMSALTGAAGGLGRLRFEVAGVGVFPNPRNARVVWVGVSGDIEKLTGLQAAVEDAMARLGMKREERKFTPHLTLGRIKYIRSQKSWLGALEELKDIRLPGFEVTSVHLMKSELKPAGAVYTEMGRAEL
jgi:2'-5' RNA ligase